MKLRTIIVSKDITLIKDIKGICMDSNLMNVINIFSEPNVFLYSISFYDFDLCLMDIDTDMEQAFSIAKNFGTGRIIFITGEDSKLREANAISPLQIILKPVSKEIAENAFSMAKAILSRQSVYTETESLLPPIVLN